MAIINRKPVPIDRNTSYELIHHTSSQTPHQSYDTETHFDGPDRKQAEHVISSFTIPDAKPVHWGVNWRSPTTMIILFILGTILAIGHHFYYQFLDGKVVIEASQEWNFRFGTAFAFLTKTMFAAAVGFAYNQHLWTTVRKKGITVEGLDAMFGALSNVLSFFSWDYIRRAKMGVILAGLTWLVFETSNCRVQFSEDEIYRLIPLSALITPATLTVAQSTVYSYQNMSVPAIDFSTFNPLYSFYSSNVQSDYITTANGVTPYLTRLMSSTATGSGLLPMNAVAANATYGIKFHGPSFQCSTPSPNVTSSILTLLNTTSHYLQASSKGPRAPYMDTTTDTSMAFMAIAPTTLMLTEPESNQGVNSTLLRAVAELCITGADWAGLAPLTYGELSQSGVQCEGITNITTTDALGATWNDGQFWIWVQNSTYNCLLTDTEYDVTFTSSTDGTQAINPNYKYNFTGLGQSGNYYVIANAIVNLLTGAVVADQGIYEYKTRLAETALYGALKEGLYEGTWGIPPGTIANDTKALARNLSMGSLIEELSRNLTLNLFTANQVL